MFFVEEESGDEWRGCVEEDEDVGRVLVSSAIKVLVCEERRWIRAERRGVEGESIVFLGRLKVRESFLDYRDIKGVKYPMQLRISKLLRPCQLSQKQSLECVE